MLIAILSIIALLILIISDNIAAIIFISIIAISYLAYNTGVLNALF
jgi:hypothetical protein